MNGICCHQRRADGKTARTSLEYMLSRISLEVKLLMSTPDSCMSRSLWRFRDPEALAAYKHRSGMTSLSRSVVAGATDRLCDGWHVLCSGQQIAQHKRCAAQHGIGLLSTSDNPRIQLFWGRNTSIL